MIRRKVRSVKNEKIYPIRPYSPGEIVHLLKKEPLQEPYSVIFYTGNEETESKQLATKIWSMANNDLWPINSKQLVTGLTIHRLTGRKDGIQMFKKMNSTASYSHIIQQNKTWANVAVSWKAVTNIWRYKQWFKTVIKFTLPISSLKPLPIEYVNDVYQDFSARKCSRDERGQSETQVQLQCLKQKIVSIAFFHNIKMKQLVFNLFVTCINADDFVQSSPLLILVNNENEIFKISSIVTKVFECTH